MAFLMGLWAWLLANYVQFFTMLSLMTASLQMMVRLTPTKSDDAFVERLGDLISKVMDLLKIPKAKRLEDGSAVYVVPGSEKDKATEVK